MQLREHISCPRPDIVLPALFRTEQRLTRKVLRGYALLLCQYRRCGKDRTEIVCLWEKDVVIFSFIRRFTDHREVQKPFIQFFRDLLRISAGDVIPKIGIGFLKGADLPRQVTDLIGLRQAEIDIAAGDIIQRQEFLLDLICHGYKILGPVPKNAAGKLPAIAVCGPFGAVKEQCSGLYAQTMAERGFLTIAFDPSFTGESGGNVRYMASPDINTEDFMAAVDFLSLNEKVDPDRIGIIGICGWGGMALNTAALDTRIKATVASTMYDMTRVNAKGYFDSEDSEEARYQKRAAMCAQRLEDLKAGEYKLGGGVIDPLPEDAPYFVKDYYDYYKTGRGYHARSLNSNGGWNVIGCESFINQPILEYSNEIRSAVLVMHGDAAHSCYFGRDAYADMVKDNKYADNKELLIIPGASHTDLYDGGGKNAIPFDKLQSFFEEYLK